MFCLVDLGAEEEWMLAFVSVLGPDVEGTSAETSIVGPLESDVLANEAFERKKRD